jgi:putative oxidoreductase
MTTLTLDRTSTASNALTSLLATDRSPALFAIRVALGVVMLPHGLQKVFGWFGGYGLQGTLGGFASMGIPAIFGILAIAAEFAGGLALIAGLGTRVAAFGIGATMAVAVLLVHGGNGFFMNWAGNQKGEGFEYHILAIAMSLALILGGAGRWSLDRVLSARKQ